MTKITCVKLRKFCVTALPVFFLFRSPLRQLDGVSSAATSSGHPPDVVLRHRPFTDGRRSRVGVGVDGADVDDVIDAPTRIDRKRLDADHRFYVGKFGKVRYHVGKNTFTNKPKKTKKLVPRGGVEVAFSLLIMPARVRITASEIFF